MMLLTSVNARHFKSGALSSKPMLVGFLPATPAAIDVVHLDAISRGGDTVARLIKVET
jgi:hypothetical protein